MKKKLQISVILNACNYTCYYLLSGEGAKEYCMFFSPSRELTEDDTGEHFDKPFPNWCPLPSAKEQDNDN